MNYNNSSFYAGKKIFLTGHTGFKGAWMTAVLHHLGAQAMGYSLEPESGCLFEKIGGQDMIKSIIGDIRDSQRLTQELCAFKPEIVIHLAARAILKDCFDDPKTAYETNVMGTVNLFEAIRSCESVKSVLIITTDKVYENKGDGAVYAETDPLGGVDPYSSSKTCMEFISDTYKKSYLQTNNRITGVSTARASNVIAGGEHNQTRLIPSILSAFVLGQDVELRNPGQTRPWQSVLDVLNGYLTIARKMYDEPGKFSSQWNIGPSNEGIRSVREVVEKMLAFYNSTAGYKQTEGLEVIESQTLGLDISKAVKHLDWQPRQSLETVLFDLVDFFKRQQANESEKDICLSQIENYFRGN